METLCEDLQNIIYEYKQHMEYSECINEINSQLHIFLNDYPVSYEHRIVIEDNSYVRYLKFYQSEKLFIEIYCLGCDNEKKYCDCETYSNIFGVLDFCYL